MSATSRPSADPPHPQPQIDHAGFILLLRRLRRWSELTLEGLEAKHDVLKRSTTSDYLRGIRFPDWEFVEAFVSTCLVQRGMSAVRVHAELGHWRTAWTDIQRQRLKKGQSAATPQQNEFSSVDPARTFHLYGDIGTLGIPTQLPHDVEHFTGRSAELTALDELLSLRKPGLPVIGAIVGMPAVGKTGLAVRWSYRCREEFEDGNLYVDLNGFGVGRPLNPSRVLADFLLALGLPSTRIPTGIEGRAALFRSVTTTKRTLIVLDNAASYDQIRRLLPAESSCLVIVTSRLQLAELVQNDGAIRIHLQPLEPPTAVALLTSFVGIERIEAEAESAQLLAERAQGLPLTLRAFGTLLAQRQGISLSEVVNDVPKSGSLYYLGAAEETILGVQRSLDWSYRMLSGSSAVMLRLLSLHPGPEMSMFAAAALGGIDRRSAQAALNGLVAASLINQPYPGRYRLHDLIRDYAKERATAEMSDNEMVTAERRTLAWYLHSADAADTQIAPQRQRVSLNPVSRPDQTLSFADRAAAIGWCDTELSNLSDAVERAVALNEHEIAWRLPAVLWNYFYLRKNFDEWEHMYSVGLGSAKRLGDPVAESIMYNGLASACRHQRRFSEAVQYYERALNLQNHDDDPWSRSWLLNNLAESLRGMGEHERAFDLYNQALALSEAIGDSWSRGCFLTNLGEGYTQVGRYEDAIASYHASLPLRREHEHLYGEGWTYNNLGEAYQQLGQIDDALANYNRSLEIRRRVDDRFGEAWTLHNIAEILTRLGRSDEAVATFTHALELRRETGDRWGAACSADSLAISLAARGRHDEARALWEEALAVFDEVDSARAAVARERLIDLNRHNEPDHP